MEKTQTYLNWLQLVCLSGHFFCCVLPLAMNVMNLVAFTGLTAITFDEPDIFHQYETLMVIFSGAALSLSGIFHYISKKIDCHDTGCVHGSCEPKKKVSFKLFYVSLALFLINLIFYLAH